MAASASVDLDQIAINTVRTLAMDAVQAAESGHPGTPMALAPLAYVLFTRHDAPRPVGSALAGSRPLRAVGRPRVDAALRALFLCGYDLSLDDIKQFRQWESRTPGHPEVGHTPGVETTTGPLGQGIANAVGMAVAEPHPRRDVQQARPRDRRSLHLVHRQRRRPDGRHLPRGGVVRRPPEARQAHRVLRRQQHHDRRPRPTSSFTDDTAERFEAYGWQVLHIDDVNDLASIERAIAAAKADTRTPDDGRHQDAHRLRAAQQARHREGARRAARQGEIAAHQEGTRLAEHRTRSSSPTRRWRIGARR